MVRNYEIVQAIGAAMLFAGLCEAQLSFTQYPVPNALPAGISRGPDGAMWFAGRGIIGRITLAGVVTSFPLPSAADPSADPLTIVAGPDGALWFTEPNIPRIGRITTAGIVTEFSLPTSAAVFGITAGPDGALWFTAANQIGRITTAGGVTMFPIGGATSVGITSGPDGALWYTDWGRGRIGRITTAGVVTDFDLHSPFSQPTSIVTGFDGALWFSEVGTGKVGRLTTAGAITEFAPPGAPYGLTRGPDNALWYSATGGIGRIDMGGQAAIYPVPGLPATTGIATASDGTLWATASLANRIIRASIVCTLDLGLSYFNGTLSLRSSVGTKRPLTWNTWLVSSAGLVRLWSTGLGVINPPAVVNTPIAPFPALGNVGVISTLNDTTEGLLCSVWRTVFTGGSGATLEELQRRVRESGILTGQQ